jgi:superfamily II RNA helicase
MPLSTYLHTVDVSAPCTAEIKATFPFPLDPFQKHAVAAIDRHENVLVTAKTGSGKTLVGEYQITASMAKGRRVFYTTPIKSLSNQKFHDLKQIWGDQVGILTGDIKYKPDAPIVVMTTEILRNLLFKYTSSTKNLGLSASLSIDDLDAVVFDEVHYINNRERGRVWEETLILLPPSVNLVLLSATIDGPELFASWLGDLKKKAIYLISTQYRIVPLRHTVLSGTNFVEIMDNKESFSPQLYNFWLKGRAATTDQYKQHQKQVANRRQGGYEDPVVHGSKRPVSYVHQLNETIQLLHEKELLPALFFVFSRKSCETFANKVQGTLLTPTEAASVKHIVDFHLHRYPAVYNTTKQYFTLRALLERGVAFHHSGLLPLLKEIIEILFTKGLVKVLFATETFAVGINMPTKTVVFTGFQKYDDETNGLRMLYTDEYIQMAGRAGRRGKDTEGLIVYLPERDPVGVADLESMMKGKKSTFISRMNFHYDFILKTVHSGNTDWIRLMSESYWFQQHMKRTEAGERWVAEAEQKIKDLAFTPELLEAMEEKESLENTFKTTVNAARKKAQQALEAWKNTHVGPVYIKALATFKTLKDYEADLRRAQENLYSLQAYKETLYPMFYVLKELGFLGAFEDPCETTSSHLTPLGTLATELNEGNPLLMSYAFQNKICSKLTGEEILCFLCAFMQERSEGAPSLASLQIPSAVKDALYELDTSVDVFLSAEKKFGVVSPHDYWSLNSMWIEPVWRWIQGDNISAICETYEIYEGNFMRTVLKVANLLEEWTSMATFTQSVEELAKLEGLQAKLVRDAAIPESLYLKL